MLLGALVPRFTGSCPPSIYQLKHGTTTTEIHHGNLSFKRKSRHEPENAATKIPQDLSGRDGEDLMEGTMNFFSRSPLLLDFPSSPTSFSLALLDWWRKSSVRLSPNSSDVVPKLWPRFTVISDIINNEQSWLWWRCAFLMAMTTSIVVPVRVQHST
jgi:hypothetical protein